MEVHPSSVGKAIIDETGFVNNQENSDISIKGSVHWVAQSRKSNLQYTVIDVDKLELECNNPLNVAEFWMKIEMRRKLKPFMIQTYAPTSAVVVVSWISFLVPFDSYPGRAGLLAGLVLCLINICIHCVIIESMKKFMSYYHG